MLFNQCRYLVWAPFKPVLDEIQKKFKKYKFDCHISTDGVSCSILLVCISNVINYYDSIMQVHEPEGGWDEFEQGIPIKKKAKPPKEDEDEDEDEDSEAKKKVKKAKEEEEDEEIIEDEEVRVWDSAIISHYRFFE